MAKFCGNCGIRLQDGVIFCGECGTKVAQQQTGDTAANTPQPPVDLTPQAVPPNPVPLFPAAPPTPPPVPPPAPVVSNAFMPVAPSPPSAFRAQPPPWNAVSAPPLPHPLHLQSSLILHSSQLGARCHRLQCLPQSRLRQRQMRCLLRGQPVSAPPIPPPVAPPFEATPVGQPAWSGVRSSPSAAVPSQLYQQGPAASMPAVPAPASSSYAAGASDGLPASPPLWDFQQKLVPTGESTAASLGNNPGGFMKILAWMIRSTFLDPRVAREAALDKTGNMAAVGAFAISMVPGWLYLLLAGNTFLYTPFYHAMIISTVVVSIGGMVATIFILAALSTACWE